MFICFFYSSVISSATFLVESAGLRTTWRSLPRSISPRPNKMCVEQLIIVEQYAIVERMESIISSKYQVVIPLSVRKGLNLKPGQKVIVKRSGSHGITIETPLSADEVLNKYAGSMPAKSWGKDPITTIRSMRDDWNT